MLTLFRARYFSSQVYFKSALRGKTVRSALNVRVTHFFNLSPEAKMHYVHPPAP